MSPQTLSLSAATPRRQLCNSEKETFIWMHTPINKDGGAIRFKLSEGLAFGRGGDVVLSSLYPAKNLDLFVYWDLG